MVSLTIQNASEVSVIIFDYNELASNDGVLMTVVASIWVLGGYSALSVLHLCASTTVNHSWPFVALTF